MHGLGIDPCDVEVLLKNAASQYRAERIKWGMIVQLFSVCTVDVAEHKVNEVLLQALK